MKLNPSFPALVCLFATGFCAAVHGGAATALAEQLDLTPESLIRSFAGFTFELSAQLQNADTFLQRKRGDCDDFASLASWLLTDRGYKTKLVVVIMEQQTHVVCHVKEAHGFLDFNHRSDAHPIIESGSSLEDIADKVAGDFRGRWQTASEFRYEHELPVYVETVFPAAAASSKEAAAVTPAAEQTRHGTDDAVSSQPVSSAPIGADTIAQAGKSSPIWRKGH